MKTTICIGTQFVTLAVIADSLGRHRRWLKQFIDRELSEVEPRKIPNPIGGTAKVWAVKAEDEAKVRNKIRDVEIAFQT